MDHMTVNHLIAEGEQGRRVDFKRELHLDTGEQKAELVKDVISLANLPPGIAGYLLVGVDNEKFITGCSGLEEERIQQIVRRYVRPVPVVRCQMVAMQTADRKQIGVVEIQGDERPYCVASPLCDLKQDQVKVRRGSVVDDATPEEVRQMHEETERCGRISGLVESAETHLELGRFTEAIRVYSQVIHIAPTAEMFLARAMARCRFVIEQEPEDAEAIRDQAIEDYGDAVHLAESLQIEKKARLERLRLEEHFYYYTETWNEDVGWLEENTSGHELGEVLYLKWARYGTRNSPTSALEELGRAIDLGYSTASVYYLRAIAHYALNNYGSALSELVIGIRQSSERQQQAEMLEFRAYLLVKIGEFKGAHKTLARAHSLSTTHSSWAIVARGIEDEILWRYGLAYCFGTLQESQMFLASALTQVLVARGEDRLSLDWRTSEIAAAIRVIAGKATPRFWEIYPQILSGEWKMAWAAKDEDLDDFA